MSWSDVPIIGGFFTSPEQEALQKQFEQMAEVYRQYRRIHADSRRNQFSSQLDAFGPLQQVLSAGLPGIQPFNTQGALQSYDQTVAGMNLPRALYQKG